MTVSVARYPYQCRVWPNGEFGIGCKPKNRRSPSTKPVDYVPGFMLISFTFDDCARHLPLWLSALGGDVRKGWERVCPGFLDATLQEVRGEAPLALTDDPKNHKRRERGSLGLTSLGKKMIRNGAFLMQKRLPRKRVALCTLTLPDMSEAQWVEVSKNWDEILRVFLQWFHRRLQSAGMLPWVVGCVEIQEERMLRDGGLPLHAHFVYHARRQGRWGIRVEDMKQAWERAVRAKVSLPEKLSFGRSVDVALVRKSVEGYLSKYISKGIKNRENLIEKGFKMPSAWWFGVGGIKAEIKKNLIVNGAEIASRLWDLVTTAKGLFPYIDVVYIDITWEDRNEKKHSRPMGLAYCGRMTQDMREYLLFDG